MSSIPLARNTRPRQSTIVLIAWLSSDIVSLFGSALSGLAVPWMVLNLTHNTAATGIVSAVQLGMLVLANLVSGPLIDKLGPTKVSVTCDWISAGFIALIPILWFAHMFSIPLLIAVVAVVGAMRGPSNSAKSVLAPDIATYTHQSMERITGLSGTTNNLAGALGSAVGGVIIGLVGGPYALAFTSLGLGLGACMIGWIVRPALLSDHDAHTNVQHGKSSQDKEIKSRHTLSKAAVRSYARNYASDIVQGWKALVALPAVLGFTIIPAVTNMFDVAWSNVLTPAWVLSQHQSSSTLGLLFATLTFPALIGSIIATVFADRLPRFPVIMLGYLAVGFPRYMVMAFNAPLPVILVTLAIGGLGSGFLNPILGAVLYERIPAQSRGKIISLSSALAWGLMPIGSLLGGFAAHLMGIQHTLAILGILYLAVTITPLFLPSLRNINRLKQDSDAMITH